MLMSLLLAFAYLTGAAAPATRAASPRAPATCAGLATLAGSAQDAAPVLGGCLRSLPAGATLALRPGRYRLLSRWRIERPVTIVTQGLGSRAQGCPADGRGCAVLAIAPQTLPSVVGNVMPVMVAAPNVTFDHLVFTGFGGRDPRLDARICGNPALRPMGGGIRVLAAQFTLRRSVIRGMACYTALEVVSGVARLTLSDTIIGPNGDHRPGEVWADGATIHDAVAATVTGNLFVDNTDVQLIFGGCAGCRITHNRFRHGPAFRNGSFAELMIHAWPATSGRYDGTVVAGNDIDCGATRNCGFGLIVGASPWYKAPTSGGSIRDNRIRNAKVGLNVDGLTGPTDIGGNSVTASGGTFGSSCGVRTWPATNIAAASAGFVRGPARALPTGIDSTNCRPNTAPAD